MKKLIVLLLSLALVGAVFAQTPAPAPVLKFSGSLTGGLAYNYDFNGKFGTLGLADTNGSGADGMRFRLNGSYDNGIIGAKFRLQSTNFNTITIPYAFGWAKFWKGILEFQAGKLSDGAWATQYNAFGWTAGPGVDVIIRPIKGLAFGVFFPVGSAFKDDALVVLTNVQGGIKYAGSGFSVAAAVQSHYTSYPDLTFGLEVSAVPNLDIILEYKGLEFADATAGKHNVDEFISYTFDPVTVSLYASQVFKNASGSKIAYDFNPAVAWAIDPLLSLTASGYVAFEDTTFKDWSAKLAAALTIRNGSLEVGATYNQANVLGVYSAWAYNF